MIWFVVAYMYAVGLILCWALGDYAMAWPTKSEVAVILLWPLSVPAILIHGRINRL